MELIQYIRKENKKKYNVNTPKIIYRKQKVVVVFYFELKKLRLWNADFRIDKIDQKIIVVVGFF